MQEGYGSHQEYMSWVDKDADKRQETIEKALRKAFAPFIEQKAVEVIVFSGMNVHELAAAITAYPSVLKSLLAVCNIAGRAVERDLGIKNLNTYLPKLSDNEASAIAGYIKPFLPSYLEVPALSRIDRIQFVDKEIRKTKGRWERAILKTLNQFSAVRFRKRKFLVDGDQFELDAASPKEGTIKIGIDVKRVEARRDIHKRCDEIINKASKLKTAFPKAKFGAVVYYPFPEEHSNVQSRLKSLSIDTVVFASQSKESIENAVLHLLSIFGMKEQRQ